MFTGEIKIELTNYNYHRGRPAFFTSGDIALAHAVSKHIALSEQQIKAMGHPVRRIPHMVRFGFLYRYHVTRPNGGFLLALYTVGRTASVYLGLPVVNIKRSQALQSLVAVNQVLIYLLLKAPAAEINIDIRRPIPAIVTINNTFGVLAPRSGFDRTAIFRNGLTQGIVILPDRSEAASGLPVRYCFDDEIGGGPLAIKFYRYVAGQGLEEENLFAG